MSPMNEKLNWLSENLKSGHLVYSGASWHRNSIRELLAELTNMYGDQILEKPWANMLMPRAGSVQPTRTVGSIVVPGI